MNRLLNQQVKKYLDKTYLNNKDFKIFLNVIDSEYEKLQKKYLIEKDYEEIKILKDIVSLSADWMWEIDKNGKYIYISGKIKDILGYKSKDIIGKTPFDFMNKKEADKISKKFKNIVAKKAKIVNLENWNTTKNGKDVCLLTNGVPLFDRNKKFIGYRGVNVDITAQKVNKELLEKNLVQQKILSSIAVELSGYLNFDIVINKILKKIGIYTNVSRVYIFEDATDGMTTSNTYEWCNKGIDAHIKNLQNIPYETIPSWNKILKSKGMIFSDDILKLPKDLQDILIPQNIKAILSYPINISGRQFGFIGFDETRYRKQWTDSDIELLKTIASIIANTFEKEYTLKKLNEKMEVLKKINKLMVGRELRVVELKEELENIKK